jgi:hypothetical protein
MKWRPMGRGNVRFVRRWWTSAARFGILLLKRASCEWLLTLAPKGKSRSLELRPAPLKTRGKQKARGTSLGMTTRGVGLELRRYERIGAPQKGRRDAGGTNKSAHRKRAGETVAVRKAKAWQKCRRDAGGTNDKSVQRALKIRGKQQRTTVA